MFKLRRYRNSDIYSILKLNRLALQINDPIQRKKFIEELKNVNKEYIKKNGEFIVGLLNNKIIGMGALKRLSKKTAELKRMRIHPRYQRSGFGQKILNYLEKKALKLGYNKIQFYTLHSQKEAQKFYEKNNYNKYRMGSKHGLKAIFYQKKLK